VAGEVRTVAEISAHKEYERPLVVDYGSLVDLTAANGLSDTTDFNGFVLNSDGSNPI
jgi:hypothetical protein